MKIKVLIGEKYGKLTVVGLDRRQFLEGGGTVLYWLCVCDCGNYTIIRTADLRSGKTKSCGCLHNEYAKTRIRDLSGEKIGRWFVIGLSKKPDNLKKLGSYWKCKCDCGTESIVSSKNLISGKSKSCGCLRNEEMRIKYGQASFNALYGRYKYIADNRGFEFELSIDEFRDITEKDCFYCGCKPSQVLKSNSNNGDYVYNGIDRIDSSKGYILGNVVPACGTCNVSKTDMDIDEFLYWIKSVYLNMSKNDIYKGIMLNV